MKKKTKEGLPPKGKEKLQKMFGVPIEKKPNNPPKTKKTKKKPRVKKVINKKKKSMKTMKGLKIENTPQIQKIRINANIQKDLHTRIKMESVRKGKTIGSIIEGWIRKYTPDVSK